MTDYPKQKLQICTAKLLKLVRKFAFKCVIKMTIKILWFENNLFNSAAAHKAKSVKNRPWINIEIVIYKYLVQKPVGKEEF